MIRFLSPKVAQVQSQYYVLLFPQASILVRGSVSGANAPTDILESEMKRDPAFALAVSSLERCLKVREHTAVRETEFKGSVSDAALVEVVRRSGAVGGTAFRPISAGHGSACAVERALGKS